MTTSKNASRGFTLIEILIVIGIIAILAAIVIVAINPAKQFAQARNTQRESNVNTILNAIGQRMADNKGIFEGEFTIDSQDYECETIPTSPTNADVVSDGDQDGCLVPTYIPALPTDPTGTQYTVEREDNGRITVCAPDAADEDSLPDAAAICVTR